MTDPTRAPRASTTTPRRLGDDKAVRDLAAALGVRYRRDDKGGFNHSAAITLLDARGEIVFQKPDATLDSEEFVTKIEALMKN